MGRADVDGPPRQGRGRPHQQSRRGTPRPRLRRRQGIREIRDLI